MLVENENCSKTLKHLIVMKQNGSLAHLKSYLQTLNTNIDMEEFLDVLHFTYSYGDRKDCITLIKKRLASDTSPIRSIDERCMLLKLVVELYIEVIGKDVNGDDDKEWIGRMYERLKPDLKDPDTISVTFLS